MNITPISANEHSFKGTLTIKNLKNNTTRIIQTSDETAKYINENFSSTKMLNNRIYEFTGGGAAKALDKLKGYVKFFADSVGADFDKELTYPEVSKFAAEYKITDKSAEINAPEYFSIKLDA